MVNNKKTLPPLFKEAGGLHLPAWLIMLATALILLCMLGRSSLIGTEAETAESLRQLLSGKDVFSEENRQNIINISSLWSCRIRSIPALIFGLNEFTCRLPSVFAALFMLCGTMILSKDFFNRQTMYTIGYLAAGSCGFIYWGRFAGNYMTLATWAVWSAVLLRFAHDNWWWKSLFFTIVLLGIAWWGMNYLLLLPGIILIMLPHCRKIFFHWRTIPALLIALAAAAGILFAAIQSPELSFLLQMKRVWTLVCSTFAESWQITVIPAENSSWSGRNFLNLYQLLFPWSLPALIAIYSSFRKYRDLPANYRDLLWGTLLMVALTAVFPDRQWQYQLPLLPFLLIITGGMISGKIGDIKLVPTITRIMVWIISIFCSFAVAVTITWPLWEMVLFSPPPLPLMLISPVLGLAGLACAAFDTGPRCAVERISGMRGAWSGYVLAGVCVMAAALAIGYPALDIYRSGRPFWQNCRKLTSHLPAGEVIFAGENLPADARYYMALPEKCTIAPDLADLPGVLANITTGKAMMIIRKKSLEEAQEILKNSSWQIVTSSFPAEEGGVISFTREEIPGERKFVLCVVVQKTR